MNRVVLALAVIGVILASGCSGQPGDDPQVPAPGAGIVCTENLVAGLIVEVRDAATGEPAALGARGEIRDGAYVEILEVGGGGTVDPAAALKLVGAWERPGIYSIAIEKDGYRKWTAAGIAVEADECHVHPVTVQAALER